MNSKIKNLSEVQIPDLVGFLKKINYPQEELIFTIKKKLGKPTFETKDVFEHIIKLEDLIRLGIQEIDLKWLISQISMDVFNLFEKSISRGQVKAILKRVLGIKLSSTDRSQLYELRKKIRRY